MVQCLHHHESRNTKTKYYKLYFFLSRITALLRNPVKNSAIHLADFAWKSHNSILFLSHLCMLFVKKKNNYILDILFEVALHIQYEHSFQHDFLPLPIILILPLFIILILLKSVKIFPRIFMFMKKVPP